MFLVLALLVTLGSCRHVDVHRVEVAAKLVDEAIGELNIAAEQIATSPHDSVAAQALVAAYLDLEAAADTLGFDRVKVEGPLTSCGARCWEECPAPIVDACLTGCLYGCYPCSCGWGPACKDPCKSKFCHCEEEE